MWLFVLPLLVVIADQFSKYIVVENMALGQSIPVIEGIFSFNVYFKPGRGIRHVCAQPPVFYRHCRGGYRAHHLGAQGDISIALGG